jgi:hypothetical protein
MSRDKLIIFGVVLLGLLGILVYKQAKHDEAVGRPMAGSTDLPSVSAPDDIDKLSITNGDKGEVVLEKVPDPEATAASDAGTATKWVLTKPIRAEANQQGVKDLVANLKDLKASDRVNLRLDDETRKEKQLDPAHATHLIAWKGGDKKVDELFGKSGAVGELVVVSDKPDAVWAVKGFSSYLYTKEAKDFRDKEIFHFDDGHAQAVTINNSHGVFSFTKAGDKWTAKVGNKPLERFDQEKIKDMLRAYKMLTADDFGEGKALAETGLDKPEAQVTINLLGESKTYDLSVGKVSTGSNHWARRLDSDTIVQITNFAADWVLSDASKYQAAADAGAPDAGPKPKPAAKK